MEEKKPFKPDPEIIGMLESGNEGLNLAVVERLRESGKAGYLPLLISLAKSTAHPMVRKSVFALLNELKSKDSIPFLMEAVTDEANQTILRELIESCWQNGLNYSQYLPVFTGLLSHGSDEIAFEAFTVIENLEYLPSDQIIKEEILHLQHHLDGASETRRYFINEAIGILKNTLG